MSTSLLEDPSKEPLEIILTPYKGITHVPSDVGGGGVETFVFIELQKCFQKAGFVAEGMLGNIIWGFEQCGYDARAVAAGLTRLRDLGYIYYSDKHRLPIHEFNFNPRYPVWIRYQDKFKKLFVQPESIPNLIMV
jgi:hypothetical protein